MKNYVWRRYDKDPPSRPLLESWRKFPALNIADAKRVALEQNGYGHLPVSKWARVHGPKCGTFYTYWLGDNIKKTLHLTSWNNRERVPHPVA